MKQLLKQYNINEFEKITILDSEEFLCNELFKLNSKSDEIIISYNHIKFLKSSIKARNYIDKLFSKYNLIIFQNVLCELDYKDKKYIINKLKEYKGTFINITNDIEDTLYFDRIIIIYKNKVICDGKTLSVLNEEKLLKRLGYGLPFIIELNKYLMDYDITKKYYLTNTELIGAIWK